MGDPITGGIIAGTMLVGTGISASSAYAAGEGNEALAKHNAAIGEVQARDALNRGQEQAKNIREAAEMLKGSQRAAFATQNVQVGTGSAALIQAETDYIAELEVNTIKNNAALEAWGHRVGADTTRMQGRLAAAQGRGQALGTLLSGIGSAAVGYKTITG